MSKDDTRKGEDKESVGLRDSVQVSPSLSLMGLIPSLNLDSLLNYHFKTVTCFDSGSVILLLILIFSVRHSSPSLFVVQPGS